MTLQEQLDSKKSEAGAVEEENSRLQSQSDQLNRYSRVFSPLLFSSH